MNPLQIKKMIYGAVTVLFAAYVSFTVVTRYQHGRADSHKAKADALKAEVAPHVTIAKVADTQDESLKAEVSAANARTERLRRELALLQHRLAQQAETPAKPIPVVPSGSNSGDSRDAVIAKQGELIQAQDVQIVTLTKEVSTLTLARDHWRMAHGLEEKRAVELELALLAQKSAVGSALWKGRVQGFALGFGTGYVASLVRR